MATPELAYKTASQRNFGRRYSKDQHRVQNNHCTGLSPMWLLLMRRLHVDVWPGHNTFIPVSHASCVIREHAGGGHGAAEEPLAVRTVLVQLDCYSCAEFGSGLLWVARERTCKTNECVCKRRVYELCFLSGTPEGSFWTVVSIFGHRTKSYGAATHDCYRLRRIE